MIGDNKTFISTARLLDFRKNMYFSWKLCGKRNISVDERFREILHNRKGSFYSPNSPTFPVQPILRFGDCRLREFRGSEAVLRLSAALIGPRASEVVIGARGWWQRRTKICQSTFLWIWSEEPRRWREKVWRKLRISVTAWKTLIRVRSSTLVTPTWYVLLLTRRTWVWIPGGTELGALIESGRPWG